ncbi:LLM class flavin-dependent oxidoreductase [Sulfitobacter donghicola]|uniref:Luciferase-like monooxygenase n=1 Tax=Sulfitobacter donghicola DSW-25 = KCTC 12864 = JCM 14565 TaxID=1300350 RepID=A0A073IFW8_9RHOB|nr:LLM class flavin-dependent oxidoreductase [Sulfitobacter donghicola]KEJ88391.1 hypothetical protein DSW25_14925 [Sulfitobacter donghicola DSW-25 = KCTC 12864 = JCM 14565]KIN69745.1 Bacterial luciferase family protein [Sulfitobacter donghicola DSW-25 = KCTC 12864 = JCM 14565]
MKYSVLDLCPVGEGFTSVEAMQNTGEMAKLAEDLGFYRYWMAEHHNMPSIASAATAVLLAYVGCQTTKMRIGAGGIMLPNHAPLSIAEQFGTLQNLFGDRVDLGIGRAPGGDHAVWQAFRRDQHDDDNFPAEVLELMGYLDDAKPGAVVQAHPGQGTHVPLWILGSSLYGAQLAAQLGLPYAFASHFAPNVVEDASHIYRQNFKPSAALDKPYLMLGVNVAAADTDEEAAYHYSSLQQAIARLRSGTPAKLPAPVKDIDAELGLPLRRSIDQSLRFNAVGSPQTVHRRLEEIIQKYQPDELMLTGQIHDHDARKKTFEIAADALAKIAGA